MKQAKNFNSLSLNFYNIYTERTENGNKDYSFQIKSNVDFKKLRIKEILMKNEKKNRKLVNGCVKQRKKIVLQK